MWRGSLNDLHMRTQTSLLVPVDTCSSPLNGGPSLAEDLDVEECLDRITDVCVASSSPGPPSKEPTTVKNWKWVSVTKNQRSSNGYKFLSLRLIIK